MRPLRASVRQGVGMPKLLVGMLIGVVAVAERVNNPPPDRFLRRAYSAVAIIDNWLYIDGGELAQKVDETDGRDSDPMNATLAIDLSTSWSSSDVTIHETPRLLDNQDETPPPMNHAGVWNDPKGQSFYLYGGSVPYGNGKDRITKEGIWKFIPNPNDRRTGKWSLEKPSNSQVLANMPLPFHGGFVATNQTGFWIGGEKSDRTEGQGSTDLVSGLKSYNMVTKEWKNGTAADLVPSGYSRGSSGHWLPRFGPNGLVTFLGGRTQTVVGQGAQDFGNITFFDPVTRRSFWQTSTGDVPTARKDFCAVTVDSPRGGHDIFIFGGAHPQSQVAETYGDVYVLSLPGFQWFKSTSFVGKRASHSCVVAGQRQMISIGGINSNNFNGLTSNWDEDLDFKQGLGVFDMTLFSWVISGEYNADAAQYESPGVVNRWYEEMGDLSDRQWSSNTVRGLFLTEDTNKPTNADLSSDDGNDSGSSSSTGSIVGGVVGGIAGVGLVAGLAWFFIRRRNRAAAAARDKISPAESQPFGQSPIEHSSPHHHYGSPQQQYGRSHDQHSNHHQYYQGQSPEGPMQQRQPQQQVSIPADQAVKYYVPAPAQELPTTYREASELPSDHNGVTRWELDGHTATPPSGVI